MSAIDPKAVKAGDTVTIRYEPWAEEPDREPYTVAGKVWSEYGDNPLGPVLMVGPYPLTHPNVTITAHQPAPEPDYEPDTVARATLYGKHENVQVVRVDTSADLAWRSAYLYNGTRFHRDEDVTDIRRMVVIDPAKVDRAHLQSVYAKATERMAHANGIIAVLAELGIEAS